MKRLCEWCEEPFTVTRANRKYCCAAHSEFAYRIRPRPERCKLCACGAILVDVTRKVCDECIEQTRQARLRPRPPRAPAEQRQSRPTRQVKGENVRRPRPERCKLCRCGTMLMEQTRNACDECVLETSQAKQRRKDRRRRMRSGANQEPYTLGDIAERDGWRCQIPACCMPSRLVPQNVAVPHPAAPTIDHVLPLAAGGDDTRANVQLAHFKCNYMKREGGWQQLRLVG